MPISPITPSQWSSVGKVVLFIFGSTAVAVALAFIVNDPTYIALAPVLNILAVTIQKFFTTGEEQAISSLPNEFQAPAQQVIDNVTATATTAAVDAVNGLKK